MILKIVADDFGGTEGINNSIEILHKKKILFNAALFPNGKAINSAIEIIKKNPFLKIGLHFVLSEENSFTSPSTFSQNGKFLPREQLLVKSILGKINEMEVEKEVQCQFDFLKEKNINISFINGHRHIHIFPVIRDVVTDFARRNKIELRVPDEPLFFSINFKFIKKFFLNILAKQFRNLIGKSDIKVNDYFISNWYLSTPQFTIEETVKLLNRYKRESNGKVLEYMVHPAIFTEDLVKIWLGDIIQAKNRESEFNMLCSKEFSNFIKKNFEKTI